MINRRKAVWALLILFVVLNAVAFTHAYKFTHFSSGATERTKDAEGLSSITKMKLLVTGIDNPKPKNKTRPSQSFSSVVIESTVDLACWSIRIPEAKGTVILFHGYCGEKSSLISRSDEFLKMGYNTFLVDFMGSGDSGGTRTTVGYAEAAQVKDCYDHLQQQGEKNIILFGTSMGAAAILKAIDDHELAPSAILLECPFGSLYKTICARFTLMGVPTVPMAALLTFWGGAQNGYWAFSHNPSTYAKSVTCPALILFGEKDNRVSREEIDLIFANMKGNKVLKTYPDAGHNIFSDKNRQTWIKDVSRFMKTVSPQP